MLPHVYLHTGFPPLPSAKPAKVQQAIRDPWLSACPLLTWVSVCLRFTFPFWPVLPSLKYSQYVCSSLGLDLSALFPPPPFRKGLLDSLPEQGGLPQRLRSRPSPSGEPSEES